MELSSVAMAWPEGTPASMPSANTHLMHKKHWDIDHTHFAPTHQITLHIRQAKGACQTAREHEGLNRRKFVGTHCCAEGPGRREGTWHKLVRPWGLGPEHKLPGHLGQGTGTCNSISFLGGSSPVPHLHGHYCVDVRDSCGRDVCSNPLDYLATAYQQ